MVTKFQKARLMAELEIVYKALSYYEFHDLKEEFLEMKGNVNGLLNSMMIIGAFDERWSLRSDRNLKFTYIGNDKMQKLFLPCDEWQAKINQSYAE